MDLNSHEAYGERVAGVYDEWYSELDSHAVEVLADLSAGGRVLELGIGTGSVALPRALEQLEARAIHVGQHETHFDL